MSTLASDRKELTNLSDDFTRRSNVAQWEIVTVEFPATADSDVVVRHSLQPPDPEYVDYEVLRSSGPALVYHDNSGTRKAWEKGFVVLRSAVPSLKADILLTVPALRRDLRARFDGGGKQIAATQLSGVLAKAQLPASIAYEDEANVFTENQRVDSGDLLTLGPAGHAQGLSLGIIQGASPGIDLKDTSQGTDLKYWRVHNTSQLLVIDTVNDAYNSVLNNVFLANRSGDVTISRDVTSGRDFITARGVKFPATQNASSDANTLDDYEEGSWTPNITFGGGATGITYTTQDGTYVKAGQIVTCYARVTLSNKGSSVGNALLGGLPFTAHSGANAWGKAMCFYHTGMATLGPGGNGGYLRGYISPSTTSATLVHDVTGATIGIVQDTHFTNTSDMLITVVYRAAS